MKHPFWIINSMLLAFVLLAIGSARFWRVSMPEREDIQPMKAPSTRTQKSLEINLKKIYENDLFDTIGRSAPERMRPQMPALPEPPRDQAIKIPAAPEPNFLEPLDVTLKGIVVLKQDSTKNIAIMSENKTGKEGTYRVSDTLEDAQLVNIYGNKVVLLRSNGQQEVMYLREQDAKLDPSYLIVDGWDAVIKPLGPNRFGINPTEFSRRIESLAALIDVLGLTSAYKKGKSVGCRIGNLTEKSLGGQLGLQRGDIITSVNDIPATTTENRLRIYKNVIDLSAGGIVRVAMTRTGRELVLELVLQQTDEQEYAKKASLAGNAQPKKPEKTYAPPRTMKDIAEESKRFSPTIDDIRGRERLNMVQRGRLSPQ